MKNLALGWQKRGQITLSVFWCSEDLEGGDYGKIAYPAQATMNICKHEIVCKHTHNHLPVAINRTHMTWPAPQLSFINYQLTPDNNSRNNSSCSIFKQPQLSGTGSNERAILNPDFHHFRNFI